MYAVNACARQMSADMPSYNERRARRGSAPKRSGRITCIHNTQHEKNKSTLIETNSPGLRCAIYAQTTHTHVHTATTNIDDDIRAAAAVSWRRTGFDRAYDLITFLCTPRAPSRYAGLFTRTSYVKRHPYISICIHSSVYVLCMWGTCHRVGLGVLCMCMLYNNCRIYITELDAELKS